MLRHIDLTVAEGETVVLLGRSGSGKTTLLKCVNGMAAATEGEVRFQGRRAAEWDLIRMRRRMGYVIQEGGLFPHWTVAGTWDWFRGWRGGRGRPRPNAWTSCWKTSGCRQANSAAVIRGSFRAARSSGWESRGPWREIRRCFCWTSLSRRSTPSPGSTCNSQFLELRRKPRKTALFVTHDVREALMLASRIVLLRQGSVELAAAPAEFVPARSAEARAFLAGLETDLELCVSTMAAEIPALSMEHAEMVLLTLGIAPAIGLPGAVVLTRTRRLEAAR